jgi:predicted adenylyl cyclase CyaB
MREVELKGVVADPDNVRRLLEAAGAVRAFSGAMVDRRYDTPTFALRTRDEVLRIRLMDDRTRGVAQLDFKGPTSYPHGFKVREEIGTEVADADVMHRVLVSLGYVVTREIEREVEVFMLGAAMVRLEWYPRMDVLAEVEGEPEAIEHAIAVTGLARDGFTTERLSDFARRFEARTGQRAAFCARELTGEIRYLLDDA